MKNLLFWLLIGATLFSCTQKKQADLIITNAKIETLFESIPNASALAVLDGNIVDLGSSEEILEKYKSDKIQDLDEAFVYPGFIDAHSHFLGYARSLLKVDLRNSQSQEEALERAESYSEKYPELEWVTGRGWDHTLWGNTMPSKELLDSIFPDHYVFLKRVDGHAAWVNSKALELAGITETTIVEGGEIQLKNGKPSGILIDNACDLVGDLVPEFNEEILFKALKEAEKKCFEAGLTGVTDAGLETWEIKWYDSLAKSNSLGIRVYGMSDPGNEELEFLSNNGKIIDPFFSLRSVKLYADGALGSRGACLKEEYSDREAWRGFLLSSADSLREVAELVLSMDLQLNTHCIGDSANAYMLKVYDSVLPKDGNQRWRIEHAQVVSEKDADLFDGKRIIASVQPTHATSDMRWAEERLGSERVKDAYAFKTLMKNAGLIALGTDFPVERIHPLETYYASVARKDKLGNPENGFQMENALDNISTLKGMTIWAAYSQFEEEKRGSLQPGKYADLVVLDKDLLNTPSDELLSILILGTMVNGNWVYQKEID